MSFPPVRTGATLGTQNGLHVEQLPEYARQAERLGCTELWTEEAGGVDGVTTLASAAMTTREVALGTAIIPVFGRAPAVVAMEAAGLQALSGGRLRLGLGASTETIATAWRGEAYRRPLSRLVEYADVVRRLLEGQKVTHHGEVHLDGFRLQVSPLPPAPPIYFAALGERALQVSAERADGIVFGNMTPAWVAHSAAAVAEAAVRHGRVGRPDIVGRVTVLIDDDLERARSVVGRLAGFYLSTAAYRASLSRQGYDEQVSRFSSLWDAGDRAAAVAGLDDDVLNAFALYGPKETVRRGVEAYREAGLHAPILYPIVPEAAKLPPATVLDRTLQSLADCL